MVVEPVDLLDVRRQLMSGGLDESTAPDEPLTLFDAWLAYATELGLHNANAVAIATAAPDAVPSVRNVLLKGRRDGGFVFYTNYESRKGTELTANPVAEGLFSWLPLERQVRVTGPVSKVSADQSDAYFATRGRDSRISAIASQQSRPVASRAELEARHAVLERDIGSEPPRPEHWGGFLLVPNRVEFWQGREHRLHDRLVYQRDGDGWSRTRLQP